MKSQVIFLFAILFALFSCSKDDTPVKKNPEDIENTVTTPCEFDLSKITENETVIIDCVLDLKGETITLPKNVTFDFKGGDIINGGLVFSKGKIDGRLLNHTLDVSGEASLKAPVFIFHASRWDMKEGKTTSAIALGNTKKFEDVLFLTQKLGAITFKVDKLDAYFEVTKVTNTTTNQNWYPTIEAVNLPSNFHLSMTENTHLRIFPGDKHNRKGGAILAVRDAENVTVTGGNFYGDRDERVFSPDDDGTEGSHLFYIHSGRNVIVDGVHFENGSAGTFGIFSLGFSFNPDYKPTKNITIKNCTIKNSRRMAIALTDGRDITIENNTFINAGQPSANTDGGEVGYAINIEPVRKRNTDGSLKEYQRVFDVLIKGNTEKNSRGGFVTLTIGQDITVENNTIGTRVVYSLVSGVKVVNNTFNAQDKAVDSWAIFTAGSGETVFNNEVANNTIEGYSLGIAVGSYDAYVHDNVIKNCGAGIQISKAIKARIHNNTIDVTKNALQATNSFCDLVEIKGNVVKTSGNYNLYFTNVNTGEGKENNTILVEDNTFLDKKALIFSKAIGVTFNANKVEGGLSVGNVKNMVISKNEIKPNEIHGIRLYEIHNNLSVINNTITKPSNDRYKCIDNSSTTSTEITLKDNTCN